MEIQSSGNIQLNITGDKAGRVEGQNRPMPAVRDELSTESSAWVQKALAEEGLNKREILQIRRELLSGRLDGSDVLSSAAANMLKQGI